MRHSHRWMVALLLIIAVLLLAGCAQTPAGSTSKVVGGDNGAPARVEHLGGTGLNRVILSAQADKRLGIQTAPVREAQVGGKLRKIVPYAALIYDLHGQAWVYTNPAPLTFVRASVTVDRFADRVGNQFVATIYQGRASYDAGTGAKTVRFLCLHGGVERGPLFVYALD